MKNMKFIDYGTALKLEDYETQKEYVVNVCGTKSYSSPEMKKAIENKDS